MFESKGEIDKEKIFRYVTEEQIFEKYLGIRVVLNKSIINPLRYDKEPGCRFYYNGTKTKFIDYSRGINEDCIGMVMIIYNCNFDKALKQIATDFNIMEFGNLQKILLPSHRGQKEVKKVKIKVSHNLDEKKAPLWRKGEKLFWIPRLVDSKVLAFFNVKPIRGVFLDGYLRYLFDPRDIGFHYAFSDGTSKIYFPDRKRYKFLNNSTMLQGYDQLPDTGDILIIT